MFWLMAVWFCDISNFDFRSSRLVRFSRCRKTWWRICVCLFIIWEVYDLKVYMCVCMYECIHFPSITQLFTGCVIMWIWRIIWVKLINICILYIIKRGFYFSPKGRVDVQSYAYSWSKLKWNFNWFSLLLLYMARCSMLAASFDWHSIFMMHFYCN